MSAVRIAVGAVCAAVLVAAVLVVFGGGDNGYIVKAEFKDAGGVRKNSDVKIGEVPAGRVIGVDLSRTDTAIVTMKLDDGVGPVGADATARSRPVNLLGEKYVDLEPGSERRPVASGTTIPAARTKTAVELDDILNTLQPGTRARLRILINEAGIAMSGRGADFNQLLEQMPAGLDQAATFLGALSSDTRTLDGLVEKGDRVLAAVSSQRTRLGALIDRADAALGTVAGRRAALGRTVAAAPGGLAQLRTTLGDLRQAGDDLRPAAANLRATSAPLASTLRQLPGFAEDARQTLAQATAVAPTLARLGTQAAPTVKRLRPTLAHLADFTRTLAPLTKGLADGGVLHLLRFANNWAGLTSLQDGVSHIFRVRLLLGPDALTSTGEPRTPKVRSRAPRHGAHTPAAPDQPSAPAAAQERPSPRLPAPVADLLKKVDAATDEVLGGDPQAAVDGLLKGVGLKGSPARGDTGGAKTLLDQLLGK